MPQWVAQSRSCICAASSGAPLDGPSQAVSLSVVVPDHSCKICSGDAARLAVAGAPLPESKRRRGGCPRPSKGKSQLHHGDSSASFAGAAAPAIRGRQMTFRSSRVTTTDQARMNPSLASLICACGIAGLFYLDRDNSIRTSKALWLPVIWIWIIGSRPVSVMARCHPHRDAMSQLDGSPVDAAIFGVLWLLPSVS